MIFSIFASLFSPATTTTTTTSMDHAPSPLSSTPLSSDRHVLSTTTLPFDPMEVDYITMPQGTKRKLNQLYQSMGELPRKGSKTEPLFMNKELLAAAKFEKKQQLRRWYNTIVATPAYEAMAYLLAKETSMKSLFFRHKNNSFSFDFVALASNSEPTTTSFAKSPSHDSAMYVFKANSKQVLTGDFSNAPRPSPAPSSIPPSAPPSDLQDASMDDATRPVAESTELPLSHPSRLGNSILCRRKDPMDSAAYGLTSALKDVERAVRTGKKSSTVFSGSAGKKPSGISKKSKVKGARHQPLTASIVYRSREEIEEEAGRRNRMPIMEEDSSDDDDTPETSPPVAASAMALSSTPAPAPAHVAPLSSPAVIETAICSSNKSRTSSKKVQKSSQRGSESSKKRGVVKNRHHGKVKSRSLRMAPESTADEVTDFRKRTIFLIANLNKEDDFSKLRLWSMTR